MGEDFRKVILLADYGSISLAERVYEELSKRDEIYGGLTPFNPDGLSINRFGNGEIDPRIVCNVRGRDVFLFKSFNICPVKWDKNKISRPTLDMLVYEPSAGYDELFVLNDTLRRSRASTITNVLPYMPYQRQDRRAKREGKKIRCPISAKVYAKKTEASGANMVINLDPHFKQIEGFYDEAITGFEELDSFVIFAEYTESNLMGDMGRVVFVAPDHGSAERASDYATYFERPLAIVDKRRVRPGVSEVRGIITDESLVGSHCILTDDLVDGGGTLVEAAKVLKAKGAKDISSYCTHPVLSGTAKDKLLNEGIKLVTTESILIPDREKYPNITVLDISYPIAQAMWCICNGRSLSQHLFDYDRYKEYKAGRAAQLQDSK
ncbi:MAG: ribose-phosphate diphosphokinase [Nanoarchaeota archaeon]|nr:ribose-phosphate diphosphokinase [Nanoarchaeota archaeon]